MYRLTIKLNTLLSYSLNIDVSTFDELKHYMDNRMIEGCLIDSYVAAYHKEKFSSFRVNSIIKSNKAFGIVLGQKLSTTRLYQKFADYLETNKARITMFIETNSDTLTVKNIEIFISDFYFLL